MFNNLVTNLTTEWFMLEGGISIIKSMGIIDFIFIIFIGFISFIVLLHLLSGYSEGLINSAIIGVIVYFTVLYFYKIDNGIYLAETIEKNGKVIGNGIEKDYKFDIVNTDYIKIIDNQNKEYSPWDNIQEVKFIFNKNKSNYIIKTYEEQYTKSTITVSLTGTVYWHEPKGKMSSKIKVHN